MLEILSRICKIIKDFCGVLTEDAIRKNFILIYELLDEMIVIPSNFNLIYKGLWPPTNNNNLTTETFYSKRASSNKQKSTHPPRLSQKKYKIL